MKFNHTLRFCILALLTASFALAGCSTPTPAPQAPAPEAPAAAEPAAAPGTGSEAPAPQEAAPAAGGPKSVTFLYPQQIETLNPLYATSYFERITGQVWNARAWNFDEDNLPQPLLVKEIPSAENGGISADGLTITMKLRDDLKWSDGTPLTSEDFRFTYEMYISSNNSLPGREPYNLIQSFETPDPQTVVMTFYSPYAPWLAALWHGVLPSHILRPVFTEQGTIDNAEWNTAPVVGCGPFVFAEWEPGSHIRFTANANYWLGAPKLSEVTIRFTNDAEQVAALTSGQADLGTYFAFSDIPALEGAGLKVQKVFSGYVEGLQFYLNPIFGHPALQDIRVRQAIALAINRQAVLDTLFAGQALPGVSIWDNTPYVEPTLQPWPYDPAKAAALLDEAGWSDTNGDGLRDRDGVDLSLTYGTTTRAVRQQAQALIREQLLQVGIRLDLTDYEPNLFFAGFGEGGPAATGQLDLYQLSSSYRFPDPDSADFLCSQLPSNENPGGVNWTAFCNQELNDLLLKQISQVGYPDTERQATFHQISRIVFERAYFIGLWQDPDVWALNSKLVNVRLSGVTPFFNLVEWDLQ